MNNSESNSINYNYISDIDNYDYNSSQSAIKRRKNTLKYLHAYLSDKLNNTYKYEHKKSLEAQLSAIGYLIYIIDDEQKLIETVNGHEFPIRKIIKTLKYMYEYMSKSLNQPNIDHCHKNRLNSQLKIIGYGIALISSKLN